MWFGVSPLRWNRPRGVQPRQRATKSTSKRTPTKPTPILEPILPSNQPISITCSPQLSTQPDQSIVAQQQITIKSSDCAVQTVYGHSGSVCAVVATDERYIISCSADMSIRVWSRGSFNCYHVLKAHRDVVSCVDISKDYLISGSHDKTIGIWMCLHDFKLKRRLEGHLGHVTKVQFVSPTTFLSGSEDFTIRLWHVENINVLHVYSGHQGYISCWLLMKNRLWSGAADANIRVWSLDDNNLSQLVQTNHRKTIQSIVHTGMHFVASASNDGTIELYHSESYHILRTFDVHAPVYHLVHGNLKPNYLIASTGEGHVLLYDLEQSSNCSTLDIQIHSQWISHFKLKNYFLACVAESTLFIIDIRSFDIVERADTNQIVIQAIEWLNTTTIISSGKDGIIKLFKFPKLPL